MNYTQLTVTVKGTSELAHDAAESINVWAAGAGYSGGFNEKEIAASRARLEDEILSCDEYIRSMLSIEQEVIELEE